MKSNDAEPLYAVKPKSSGGAAGTPERTVSCRVLFVHATIQTLSTVHLTPYIGLKTSAILGKRLPYAKKEGGGGGEGSPNHQDDSPHRGLGQERKGERHLQSAPIGLIAEHTLSRRRVES